jgi:16S rRNA (uracil1498-N3)-methyltransferase
VPLSHFFVPSLAPGRLVLAEADSRHALRSLRLRPGDQVSLADGKGAVAEGRLVEEADGKAVVEVGEARRVVRPGPVVSIALSPPKGDRLAWAVQKLAELGVDETILIRTEHSVRAWQEDRAGQAVVRLEAVAREAAMQARRPFLMEVRPPVPLEEALNTAGAPLVALWEGASEPLSACLPEEAGGIRVVVGPEGGFSEREVATIRRGGAALASLGPGILRTETAAIVGAALVLARYGRLG